MKMLGPFQWFFNVLVHFFLEITDNNMHYIRRKNENGRDFILDIYSVSSMKRAILIILALTLTATIHADNETITGVLKGVTYVLSRKGLSRDSYSRITRGILARSVSITAGNIRLTLAAGKEISFYKSGAPAIVFMTKNRILPAGKYRLRFRGDMPLHLYESGALKSGYLAGTQTLRVGPNTVPFKAGINEIDRISFHPSGRIRIGMLAKPAIIIAGKKSYYMNNRIGFYESGRVEFGHLARDTSMTVGVNRMILTGGEYHNLEFYENGEIFKAYLAKDHVVKTGGSEVTLRCTVEFQKGGRVIKGYLAKEFNFQDRLYRQFGTVTFGYDASGALTRVAEYYHPHR